MKRTNFWLRKLSRRALQMVASSVYINPDPDISRSILVAGTARSGTTWLGDLIAAQIPCRILFEPFNPNLVQEYRDFNYFQYLRPGEDNQKFQDFARKIFTGEIRNRWIDRQNEHLFAKYRLIKEIRINLSLKWLHDNFQEVPIVFLVRHPCAVVLSRLKLGWATDRDIDPLLSQPKLITDYLTDHLELINNAKTNEEKHAIIWCVSHLVPLRQFKHDEIKVVFYENLCTQPEKELTSIFEFLGHRYGNFVAESINQPSQTTKETSAVVTGTNKITHWKDHFSQMQIKQILTVVQDFGLGHLYDDSPMPINSSR